MCENRHPIGAAVATRRIRTDYGTFRVCDDCAESARLGGYVLVEVPLGPMDKHGFCECEHIVHAEASETYAGSR